MHRFIMLLAVLPVLVACDKQQPADSGNDIEFKTGSTVTYELPPEAAIEQIDAKTSNTSSVAHPIAGRSPFPASGEVIETPIPAKRLSEEDQFRSPIDPADIPKFVPWQQAGSYAGHEITVQGTIIDIGQSRDGKVNFLNYHQDWRDKFYLVVFDDLAKTLPKSVAETFLGKTLRVKGLVEDHRGRPQIKILSMDQVEFVGE